ncbi:MAG: zinc-ribbon domain-containing protein, partial [Myxococcales bacterium]|nr:zinc-ribbon domain-containing protein [Myxococcales bacterium]
MKFKCDNCGQRYNIDDSKLVGRTMRFNCKSCRHTISVSSPGSVAPPVEASEKGAWHYSVNGKSFGPFDQDDLIAKFLSGQLGDEAYVWNSEMDGWEPAVNVPVFAPSIHEGSKRNPQRATLDVPAVEDSSVHRVSSPPERGP